MKTLHNVYVHCEPLTQDCRFSVAVTRSGWST